MQEGVNTACQSMTALLALERSEKAQRRPGGRDAEEENNDDGSGKIIRGRCSSWYM